MRTKGANTKKECWCLKIYYPDKNIIIKEGVYITLKDVAKDLGLSYNQTTELTSNGRNKTKNKFNFYPTIELYKIEKLIENTNPIDSLEPPIIDDEYIEEHDDFLQDNIIQDHLASIQSKIILGQSF